MYESPPNLPDFFFKKKENPCNYNSSLFPSSLILHFYSFPTLYPMPRLRLTDLEPALQAIATENYVFRNWAKTFTCTAEILFTPTSEDEIVKVTSLFLQIVYMDMLHEANRSIVCIIGTVGKKYRSCTWHENITKKSRCLVVDTRPRIWRAHKEL